MGNTIINVGTTPILLTLHDLSTNQATNNVVHQKDGQDGSPKVKFNHAQKDVDCGQNEQVM